MNSNYTFSDEAAEYEGEDEDRGAVSEQVVTEIDMDKEDEENADAQEDENNENTKDNVKSRNPRKSPDERIRVGSF